MNDGTVVTQEMLRRHFRYWPITGRFTRLDRSVKRGQPKRLYADIQDHGDGYRTISFMGRRWLAHRLAWLYVHGQWPPDGFVIDHINRDPGDNRLANLRLATHGQNNANSGARKHNRLGVKGVTVRGKKYFVQLSLKKSRIYVGTFDTIEEAAAAYADAARKHHGEFARSA
jgi:hypothetical protein